MNKGDLAYPIHVDSDVGHESERAGLQTSGVSPALLAVLQGQHARSAEGAPSPGARPRAHAVQKAHEQQVGRQRLDAAKHQGSAFGAAQPLVGLGDPLETWFAEGVLAREDFGCDIELFQAHGALQEIK